MKIEVMRKYFKSTYTIGELYIDGEYVCDTLEDKDRGLDSDMELEEIRAIKVYGQTAIPYGTYRVTVAKWKKYNIEVPLLHNVKGFSGILIHNGTDESHTSGCILVGRNTIKGKLTQGKYYMNYVSHLVKCALFDDDTVDITIKSEE